jgi:putative peptide zinc metalloprotease protein
MATSSTIGIEPDWVCPDLRSHWAIARVKNSDRYVLQSRTSAEQLILTADEACALQHFTGQYTVAKIHQLCQQKQNKELPPDFLQQLLAKLTERGIIEIPNMPSPAAAADGPQLKSCVHWIQRDGVWLLRNPENITYFQANQRAKAVIDDLGKRPPQQIYRRHQISKPELQNLLKQLSSTGMLEGTEPQKPSRGKFTPLHLLFFRKPLFNPDPWLSRHVDLFRWIWTRPFAFLLLAFLGYSLAIGLDKKGQLMLETGELWNLYGLWLVIPFALLAMLVVTLHELGHAFTLKHFGGIVPEMGLMLIIMMPAAYTNTTDSYHLSRWKRLLVVGAGVLVQFTTAALAIAIWQLSAEDTWPRSLGILLVFASLFTVALNLNPLAKFDGYYLATIIAGINNLRPRSFQFYGRLLQLKSPQEPSNCWLPLTLYAPLCLLYIFSVFGFLFGRILTWSLTEIPTWTLILISLWALYYFAPNPFAFASQTNNAQTNNPKDTMSQAKSTSTQPHTQTPPKTDTVPQTTDTPQTQANPQEKSDRAQTPNKFLRRLGILGLIAGAVTAIGFIPMPYRVGGFTELTTKVGARETIRTQLSLSAFIDRIHIRSGDRVEKGDILVQLRSPELEDKIAALQSELKKAQQRLAELRTERQEQKQQAQAELQRAQARLQERQAKFQRRQQRLQQLQQGKVTPEIEQLRGEIQGLQTQLEQVNQKIHKYEKVAQEGAISDQMLSDMKLEREKIQTRIQSKQDRIAILQQDLRDRVYDLEQETQLNLDQTEIAATQINISESDIQAQQQVIADLKQKIQRWESQKQYLTIRAPITGTVLADGNLDLREGDLIEPNASQPTALMTIANLQQLVANVKIRQEDIQFVEAGKSVSFRSKQDKLDPYPAEVHAIGKEVTTDQETKKRVIPVQVIVDNPQGEDRLRPGGTGYAKIHSQDMFLYQRLGQELVRLLPARLFPSGNMNDKQNPSES